MRRKASDSATAAASAGGIGLAFANHAGSNNNNGSYRSPSGTSVGQQPIPSANGRKSSFSRGFAVGGRGGSDLGNSAPFSVSLGSAAEAISLPASVLNSGAKSGRSTGHTHFGQECFGPEPGEVVPNPPAGAVKINGPAPVPGSAPSTTAPATRRDSISESVMNDDDEDIKLGSAGGKDLPIHRCESCNKVYRHPSCLVKHRWEHTVYWKEASKFLMSKHQQVQLLEAAAILVNLDGDAASLPDEKALWPAAVSPASSGLLGSERHNFDKLMQKKAAMRFRSPSNASDTYSPSGRSIREESVLSNDAASSYGAGSMPRSVSGGLSPLNSFTKLGLNGTPVMRGSNGSLPRSYSGYNGFGSLGTNRLLNSDIQHLTLDESDERTSTTGEDQSDGILTSSGSGTTGSGTRSSEGGSSGGDRSGSVETGEGDEDESGNSPEGLSTNGKGEDKWGLHEGVIGEMEMED